jgi:hypothetical protein
VNYAGGVGVELGEEVIMKHIFLKSLASSSLLLFALTASAQAQDRDRDDPYHQGDRDEGYWRGHLFQRVREDVDHVQSVTPYFGGDQFRLVRVKRELDDLQTRYEARGYDPEAMDDVIGALQRVLTDNHLAGRDRDMLSDDMSRLREFRDHHEGYR